MKKDTSMTLMNGVGGAAVVVPSPNSNPTMAELGDGTTVVSDPSINSSKCTASILTGGGGAPTKQPFDDDDFESLLLRGEESALVHAEEKLMLEEEDDEEITSVESNNPDEEVVERTMLTMALMNSVVDQKQRHHGAKKDHKVDDIKQRLRKRRRRANQDLDLLEYHQSTTKVGGLAYSRGSSEGSTTAHDRVVPNPLLMTEPAPVSSVPPAASTAVPPHPPPAIPASPQMPFLPNKTSFSVPCPLPPAALQPPEAPPAKMVNFLEPPLPSHASNNYSNTSMMLGNRMRGFSIDLDLNLEFPDDGSASMGGVSSDIVTGTAGTGGRNRAFSFECFAFGINADEPLPPLEESGSSQPEGHESSGTAEHGILLPMTIMSNTPDHGSVITANQAMSGHSSGAMPRPRGDSIIFDPASFQDGGIHELLPGLLESGRTTELTAPQPMLPRPPQPARPKATKAHRTPSVPPLIESMNAVRSVAAPTNSARAPGAKAPQLVSSSATHLEGTSPDDAASGTTISLELLNKDGRIGIYLPEARVARIARFHAKRSNRIWRKRIKYDCRKKLADSRPRIKGRFVKRSDMDDDM